MRDPPAARGEIRLLEDSSEYQAPGGCGLKGCLVAAVVVAALLVAVVIAMALFRPGLAPFPVVSPGSP